MIEIGMNQVIRNFGFKNVLNGASLEIMTGERVAIVGRNGTGKSTLLKIISGEEVPEHGSVSIRRGATIGMLEQIPHLHEVNTTTREVLLEAFVLPLKIEERMRTLEARMAEEADASELQRLMDEYYTEQEKFSALDGYSMEENFAKVTIGFGLTELLDRPFNILSGGQKTIVNLACTVLRRPDILLLDEPTNHLDVRTLEWFEGFLAKYRGTVVIVSHDRYFLDRVVTKTILLEGGKCTSFAGNYSFTLKEQERLLLAEFEQYRDQQKKVSAMKAAIKRFRDWGNQGDNEKFYRKAKELEKRLEKMELIERPQLEKPKLPIRFSGERTGHELLRVEAFSLAFGETELFSGAELCIYEREKVCLMGDNGSGKTSFLRAVLGQPVEHTGEIVLSPSAQIGYIPQEIRFPGEKDSVLTAFQREYPCTEGIARGLLAKYFFLGDTVFKRVSSLSGGEKVMLKLAILLQNQVNLLILDEPTNHIDIEMREVLEEALLDYSGTLLFISHDRYFIQKIAGRIVEIRNGGFDSFYGDYEAYRAHSVETVE